MRVTVAVPTYRRPDDLRALLPLLLDQAREVVPRPGGRYRVDVLVVDNDPDRSAADVVAGPAPASGTWPSRRPGIAAVRNRALDEAADARRAGLHRRRRAAAPTAGWPHLLDDLGGHRRGGGGRPGPDRVRRRARPVDPRRRVLRPRAACRPAREIDVAATGNLLLDLDQVRASGVRFESALGLGGGEDTLFSRQLARAGGRMVWCDESAAVDQVPAERMTRAWVLHPRVEPRQRHRPDRPAAGRRRSARAGARVPGALAGGVLRVGGGARALGLGTVRRLRRGTRPGALRAVLPRRRHGRRARAGGLRGVRPVRAPVAADAGSAR